MRAEAAHLASDRAIDVRRREHRPALAETQLRGSGAGRGFVSLRQRRQPGDQPDKLAAIGRSDPGRALAAWRELRSAILATRSFYTPHRALLDEANRQIAELMADAELAAGTQHGHERARAWHAARLAQDEAPKLGWTLVALFGLIAWVGCAVGLLLRGIGDDDRLRPRAALAWAVGVAVGLAAFFLGLGRA